MEKISGLLREIDVSLSEMKSIDLGYPQSNNAVVPPSEIPAEFQRLLGCVDKLIADELVELFSHCNGIAMPDVHNAYFIHSVGGGLFAAQDLKGGILHLKGGAVKERVYFGNSRDAIVAPNLSMFLTRLRDDLRHFIHGTPNWKFMA